MTAVMKNKAERQIKLLPINDTMEGVEDCPLGVDVVTALLKPYKNIIKAMIKVIIGRKKIAR
jgi:hypothetical protein